MSTFITLATLSAGAAARRQSRRAVMPPLQPPESGQPSVPAARRHLGRERRRSRRCDAGKGRADTGPTPAPSPSSPASLDSRFGLGRVGGGEVDPTRPRTPRGGRDPFPSISTNRAPGTSSAFRLHSSDRSAVRAAVHWLPSPFTGRGSPCPPIGGHGGHPADPLVAGYRREASAVTLLVASGTPPGPKLQRSRNHELTDRLLPRPPRVSVASRTASARIEGLIPMRKLIALTLPNAYWFKISKGAETGYVHRDRSSRRARPSCGTADAPAGAAPTAPGASLRSPPRRGRTHRAFVPPVRPSAVARDAVGTTTKDDLPRAPR